MARPRNPSREKVKKIWLNSDGKTPTKELAEIAGVSEAQIRKWKQADEWKKALDARHKKRKRGGQPGNQNASGCGAPRGNTNAVTHGAYRNIRLEDLKPEERAFIESLNIDTNPRISMVWELQTLIAKQIYLQGKLDELDAVHSESLYIDKVIEMRVPSKEEKKKSRQQKLDDLIVERDSLVWDMEYPEKKTKANEKKLLHLECQIAALKDQIETVGEECSTIDDEPLTIATQTIIKASPFDRYLKYQAELNKVQGRIIKLIDTMKSCEQEDRRVSLEERKYRFHKQQVIGQYKYDPDTNEIDDITDDEEDDGEE